MKIEADSNDITERARVDQPSIGMFGYADIQLFHCVSHLNVMLVYYINVQLVH